jgi:hypothetical protein
MWDVWFTIMPSLLKIYPRNINDMPVARFFACLDRDQNFSFLDGHWPINLMVFMRKCKKPAPETGAFG